MLHPSREIIVIHFSLLFFFFSQGSWSKLEVNTGRKTRSTHTKKTIRNKRRKEVNKNKKKRRKKAPDFYRSVYGLKLVAESGSLSQCVRGSQHSEFEIQRCYLNFVTSHTKMVII